MVCFACNKRLTNIEATRKFASGEYTDLCNKCLSTIQDDVLTEDDALNTPDDDEEE